MQVNGNVFQTALFGLQQNQQQLQQAADTVARGAGNDTTAPAEPLLRVKAASNAAQANIRVLNAADETLGTLLNELA